jgi:hypothetical protein
MGQVTDIQRAGSWAGAPGRPIYRFIAMAMSRPDTIQWTLNKTRHQKKLHESKVLYYDDFKNRVGPFT